MPPKPPTKGSQRTASRGRGAASTAGRGSATATTTPARKSSAAGDRAQATPTRTPSTTRRPSSSSRPGAASPATGASGAAPSSSSLSRSRNSNGATRQSPQTLPTSGTAAGAGASAVPAKPAVSTGASAAGAASNRRGSTAAAASSANGKDKSATRSGGPSPTTPSAKDTTPSVKLSAVQAALAAVTEARVILGTPSDVCSLSNAVVCPEHVTLPFPSADSTDGSTAMTSTRSLEDAKPSAGARSSIGGKNAGPKQQSVLPSSSAQSSASIATVAPSWADIAALAALTTTGAEVATHSSTSPSHRVKDTGDCDGDSDTAPTRSTMLQPVIDRQPTAAVVVGALRTVAVTEESEAALRDVSCLESTAAEDCLEGKGRGSPAPAPAAASRTNLNPKVPPRQASDHRASQGADAAKAPPPSVSVEVRNVLSDRAAPPNGTDSKAAASKQPNTTMASSQRPVPKRAPAGRQRPASGVTSPTAPAPAPSQKNTNGGVNAESGFSTSEARTTVTVAAIAAPSGGDAIEAAVAGQSAGLCVTHSINGVDLERAPTATPGTSPATPSTTPASRTASTMTARILTQSAGGGLSSPGPSPPAPASLGATSSSTAQPPHRAGTGASAPQATATLELTSASIAPDVLSTVRSYEVVRAAGLGSPTKPGRASYTRRVTNGDCGFVAVCDPPQSVVSGTLSPAAVKGSSAASQAASSSSSSPPCQNAPMSFVEGFGLRPAAGVLATSTVPKEGRDAPHTDDGSPKKQGLLGLSATAGIVGSSDASDGVRRDSGAIAFEADVAAAVHGRRSKEFAWSVPAPLAVTAAAPVAFQRQLDVTKVLESLPPASPSKPPAAPSSGADKKSVGLPMQSQALGSKDGGAAERASRTVFVRDDIVHCGDDVSIARPTTAAAGAGTARPGRIGATDDTPPPPHPTSAGDTTDVNASGAAVTRSVFEGTVAEATALWDGPECTLKLADGSKYTGSFHDGVPHGQGAATFPLMVGGQQSSFGDAPSPLHGQQMSAPQSTSWLYNGPWAHGVRGGGPGDLVVTGPAAAFSQTLDGDETLGEANANDGQSPGGAKRGPEASAAGKRVPTKSAASPPRAVAYNPAAAKNARGLKSAHDSSHSMTIAFRGEWSDDCRHGPGAVVAPCEISATYVEALRAQEELLARSIESSHVGPSIGFRRPERPSGMSAPPGHADKKKDTTSGIPISGDDKKESKPASTLPLVRIDGQWRQGCLDGTATFSAVPFSLFEGAAKAAAAAASRDLPTPLHPTKSSSDTTSAVGGGPGGSGGAAPPPVFSVGKRDSDAGSSALTIGRTHGTIGDGNSAGAAAGLTAATLDAENQRKLLLEAASAGNAVRLASMEFAQGAPTGHGAVHFPSGGAVVGRWAVRGVAPGTTLMTGAPLGLAGGGGSGAGGMVSPGAPMSGMSPRGSWALAGMSGMASVASLGYSQSMPPTPCSEPRKSIGVTSPPPGMPTGAGATKSAATPAPTASWGPGQQLSPWPSGTKDLYATAAFCAQFQRGGGAAAGLGAGPRYSGAFTFPGSPSLGCTTPGRKSDAGPDAVPIIDIATHAGDADADTATVTPAAGTPQGIVDAMDRDLLSLGAPSLTGDLGTHGSRTPGRSVSPKVGAVCTTSAATPAGDNALVLDRERRGKDVPAALLAAAKGAELMAACLIAQAQVPLADRCARLVASCADTAATVATVVDATARCKVFTAAAERPIAQKREVAAVVAGLEADVAALQKATKSAEAEAANAAHQLSRAETEASETEQKAAAEEKSAVAAAKKAQRAAIEAIAFTAKKSTTNDDPSSPANEGGAAKKTSASDSDDDLGFEKDSEGDAGSLAGSPAVVKSKPSDADSPTPGARGGGDRDGAASNGEDDDEFLEGGFSPSKKSGPPLADIDAVCAKLQDERRLFDEKMAGANKRLATARLSLRTAKQQVESLESQTKKAKTPAQQAIGQLNIAEAAAEAAEAKLLALRELQERQLSEVEAKQAEAEQRIAEIAVHLQVSPARSSGGSNHNSPAPVRSKDVGGDDGEFVKIDHAFAEHGAAAHAHGAATPTDAKQRPGFGGGVLSPPAEFLAAAILSDRRVSALQADIDAALVVTRDIPRRMRVLNQRLAQVELKESDFAALKRVHDRDVARIQKATAEATAARVLAIEQTDTLHRSTLEMEAQKTTPAQGTPTEGTPRFQTPRTQSPAGGAKTSASPGRPPRPPAHDVTPPATPLTPASPATPATPAPPPGKPARRRRSTRAGGLDEGQGSPARSESGVQFASVDGASFASAPTPTPTPPASPALPGGPAPPASDVPKRRRSSRVVRSSSFANILPPDASKEDIIAAHVAALEAVQERKRLQEKDLAEECDIVQKLRAKASTGSACRSAATTPASETSMSALDDAAVAASAPEISGRSVASIRDAKDKATQRLTTAQRRKTEAEREMKRLLMTQADLAEKLEGHSSELKRLKSIRHGPRYMTANVHQCSAADLREMLQEARASVAQTEQDGRELREQAAAAEERKRQMLARKGRGRGDGGGAQPQEKRGGQDWRLRALQEAVAKRDETIRQMRAQVSRAQQLEAKLAAAREKLAAVSHSVEARERQSMTKQRSDKNWADARATAVTKGFKL